MPAVAMSKDGREIALKGLFTISSLASASAMPAARTVSTVRYHSVNARFVYESVDSRWTGRDRVFARTAADVLKALYLNYLASKSYAATLAQGCLSRLRLPAK
jgi:hypothetical protein